VNKYAANSGQTDRLVNIKDTYTTMSSVNPTRYPQEYRMLLGYPEGYQMVVTYFHRNHPDIDIRTMASEIIDREDAIHKDFTRILNLEMKLVEQLEHENREDDNTVSLTGSAIMYPGMEPYIGDIFYLSIDHNNIHVFRVIDIEPTTYRQERYYKISFSTYTDLTPELHHNLKNATLNTVVFDKKAYFGSSEYTLLEHDSYLQLQKLRQVRKAIAQDIINQFYHTDIMSYLRPDGIYDPYVTEFLRKKLTVDDGGVRAVQLNPRMRDYFKSIWYKLLDSENYTDFSDICSTFTYKYKKLDMFDSDYNGLGEKTYVDLTDDSSKEPDTYVLPKSFYAGDVGSMDPVSKIIYTWITTRKIKAKEVLSIVEKYRKFKFNNEAFYILPLYLDMIDSAIISITE